MNNCSKCTAMRKAQAAVVAAYEYNRRQFAGDGLVAYNPHEAMRLTQVAAELSDAAPDNHLLCIWYRSKHDDFAMRSTDPNAFLPVKEHMSDDAVNDKISTMMPLDLWADHVRWWE